MNDLFLQEGEVRLKEFLRAGAGARRARLNQRVAARAAERVRELKAQGRSAGYIKKEEDAILAAGRNEEKQVEAVSVMYCIVAMTQIHVKAAEIALPVSRYNEQWPDLIRPSRSRSKHFLREHSVFARLDTRKKISCRLSYRPCQRYQGVTFQRYQGVRLEDVSHEEQL